MDAVWIRNESRRLAPKLTIENASVILRAATSSSGKALTREELYWIVRYLIESDASLVSSEIRDELGEFVTGLIGHVAADCIVKLKTDPPDLSLSEFVEYVRNYRWARDRRTIWPGELCRKCDCAGNVLPQYSTEQNDAREPD